LAPAQAGACATAATLRCSIDSQSVKNAAEGQERGFHGGKRVKGRGRHISVDSQGTLLSVRASVRPTTTMRRRAAQ
jgi:putative transposase